MIAGMLAGIGMFAAVGGVLVASLSFIPPRMPIDLDMLGKGVLATVFGVALIAGALALRT